MEEMFDQLFIYGGEATYCSFYATSDPAVGVEDFFRRVNEWFDRRGIVVGEGEFFVDKMQHEGRYSFILRAPLISSGPYKPVENVIC